MLHFPVKCMLNAIINVIDARTPEKSDNSKVAKVRKVRYLTFDHRFSTRVAR